MTAAAVLDPGPVQTPGGQRENTSMLAGAAIGAILTAAQISLLALVAGAVRRVADGASRNQQARQLHAAAVAVVGEADRRVGRHLVQVEQQITTDTAAMMNTALPGAPLRTIAGVPVHDPHLATSRSVPVMAPRAPSWDRLPTVLGDSLDNAQAEAETVFRDAAVALGSGDQAGVRAAQGVLDELAARGLTVFTDAAHHRWSLPAYGEMSTRSASTRMALAVQMGMMSARALDLVIVDTPAGVVGCHLCRPYEGRVLSLSGSAYPGMAVTVTMAGGHVVTAYVVATLTAAVASGLFHPNCRHSLLPFANGLAVLPHSGSLPSINRTPWYSRVATRQDSAAYRREQVQRGLERVVRAGIQRETVALTPQARAVARRRTQAARTALHRHLHL